MSILDKAKADFAEKVGAGLKKLEVPEWDEVIYYKPAMTVAQQNKIYKYSKDGDLEGMVQALIIRALDESGKPMFKPVNRTELMNQVDGDVIGRIIAAMSEDDDELTEEAVEDAVKK